MDFSFSSEQEQIRKLAHQVLRDLVSDDSLKALQKQGHWFHEAAWKHLASSDLLGLALPEALGGAGMGLVELCILLQEVGRTVAPIPALTTLVSVALPIARFASEEQKKLWLSGVATGDTILSAALVESANRNPYHPTARAKKTGKGWSIDGEFTNVEYLDQAKYILFPARVSDEEIIVAVVGKAHPGLITAEQRGTHDQPLHQISLKNVQIEDAQVIGSAKKGTQILKYSLDVTTLGMCALELGIAEEALRLTASYSSERKQFGSAIATFQAVSQRVGDMYIDVQAMRVTFWQACWRLSENLSADRELAVAKFWAAEAGARVVASAQHIHAGMGFDRDYPLHRYFLASKHNEFTLGGASEQLSRLGTLVVAI